MTKQRSAKRRPAKAKRAKIGRGKAPAKTLADFTERGFDALRERRLKSAGASTKKRDKEGQAFAEAVERLKADYKALLKRSK
jgi:hypothetical protein